MCGIVGIFNTRAKAPIDPELLRKMNDSQYHRGPDGDGYHLEAGVGLGHRRLSIIDLHNGKQPLYNEDHSVVVTYNGEIYNFQHLRTELEDAGHSFRTDCDTEVIVHAYEQWGERCVERFRGMFAFAIWDQPRETLFLARDRLGIKPLYYASLDNGEFVFGSELKSLLVHPRTPRELRADAVDDYFAYGYVPDPKTILKNIFKLAPGHSLQLRRGEAAAAPRCYWDVPFASLAPMDEVAYGEALLEKLDEAVRIRLVADVPLGAFLSGGVDSSAVVASMARQSESAVNTCSISFGDPAFNEANYASQVASQFRTAHRTRQVDPDDYDLIDQLAGMYDEPFADSSALPTFRVCELAREQVTVALSGDGGDENLAGYRRYRFQCYEERLRAKVPAALRAPVFGNLARAYPKADWAPRMFRAKSTFQALAADSVGGFFNSVSLMNDGLRARLFSSDFKRELGGYNAAEVLRGYAAQSPTDDPLALVQYLDLKTFLVGDILTKVDRASMANSLEVRVPILDHHLVEFMSGLPGEQKLRGNEGKYIFKKALESRLPEDILYRPKMGFSIPIAKWFRGPLRDRVREAVTGERLARTGLFNPIWLREMVEQHQSNRRDFSAPLWQLLMFDAFVGRVLEGDS